MIRSMIHFRLLVSVHLLDRDRKIGPNLVGSKHHTRHYMTYKGKVGRLTPVRSLRDCDTTGWDLHLYKSAANV